MSVCIAIDVANGKSMIVIITDEGEVLLEPKEIFHNRSSFEHIKQFCKEHRCTDISVIMESTSIYHKPVERFFKTETSYSVIVLNPLISKEKKKTLRKTKTDKIDCLNLARIFFAKEYNIQTFHEDCYYEYQTLSRQIFHYEESIVRYKNRMKQLVAICFPELSQFYRNSALYEEKALEVIQKYPHPDMVKKCRIDKLTRDLKTRNHNNFYHKKALLLKELAASSYPSVSDDSASVQCLVLQAALVQNASHELHQLQMKLIDAVKNNPDFQRYCSIPGIGPLSAAYLIAELKDIRRFSSYKKLIASCGLDPCIVQSGMSIDYHFAISKRGNKYARKILYNIVTSMLRIAGHNNSVSPIAQYYRKKRNDGKHHYAAVTACTTKLLRLLFALCINETCYLSFN